MEIFVCFEIHRKNWGKSLAFIQKLLNDISKKMKKDKLKFTVVYIKKF